VIRILKNNDTGNYQDWDDAELLEAFCKRHHVEAFAELYKRYMHLLIGVCMKYLKNEQEAYDATSDIFEKLLQIVQKHNIDNFKNWLYVYTKNHCLMILRHKEVEAKYVHHLKNNGHLFVEFGLDNHHDEEERTEKYKQLMNALDDLSAGQRICLKTFCLEEKSYQEVADETGFSLNQVKSYIQNGKRNLKKVMIGLNEQ
jgi:RNA polymerase sigma-70 factor (ECF subfamily)